MSTKQILWTNSKTTQKAAKPKAPATQPMSNLHLGHSVETLFLVRDKNSFIQWPAEQEIQEVSKQLARIALLGIRFEANGYYFKSGDLAYQIQQIIRTTAELLKRCQRGKE